MVEQVTKLKIFVASPGDVQEERDRLEDIIDELNLGITREKGLVLELVRWETHAWPAMGEDAQEVVNREIGPYDVFVGIMWKRFGTPTKRAESGTKEEFDLAYELWNKYGRPHIMFYFNRAPFSPSSQDELEQMSKVLAFKEELAQKGGLYWEYDGPDEFEKCVRRHLTQVIICPSPEEAQRAEWEYVDKVYHECRYLETEGGPEMLLTEVYVMLQAQPTPRREQQTDLPPGQLPPQEMEKEIEAALVRKEPPAPLPEVLRQHQRLLILGEPGAGKTTLLQYVALCFANDLRAEEDGDHQPNLDDLGLPDEPRLPVRIELRNYQGEQRLDDFIVAGLYDKFVSETLARAWLEGERLAILLDGLDEVPAEQRRQVMGAIQTFARDRWGRNQRIVVTSRIAAYRSEKSGLDEEDFKPYTLRPLDDEEMARHYVAGWLRALDPQKEGQADKLWEEFKKQRSLKDALTNPLLLRLAVSIYARTGEVARSRAALYRLYIEDVLIPRARDYRGLELPPRRTQEALEAVAWAMQVDGVHDEGGLAEWLEHEVDGVEDGCALLMDLRAKVGLLIAYGREARELRHLLAFRHQAFREYFVARRLRKRWEEDSEATWAWLWLYLDDWWETILLLSSLLKEKEATDLLGRIMQRPKDSREWWELPVHLEFIIQALTQGACPTDAFQKQICNILLALARDEQVGVLVRVLAAGALSYLGQTEVVTEILLALARDEQLDLWSLLGAVRVLGYSDQTEALLALAHDEQANDLIRYLVAEELGNLGQTEVAIEILLALAHDKQLDADMRRLAAEGMCEFGQTEAAADILLALVRNGQVDIWVRIDAAEALGRLGQATEAVLSGLSEVAEHDPDEVVRQAAREALQQFQKKQSNSQPEEDTT